jgi:hypothetical protein
MLTEPEQVIVDSRMGKCCQQTDTTMTATTVETKLYQNTENHVRNGVTCLRHETYKTRQI